MLDCRTRRGTHVGDLDHAAIFARQARTVELTAIREVLGSHPFLYNHGWCRTFAKELKKDVKKHAGDVRGPMILFAIGDSADHAPDQDDPMPDFNMKVAPFFLSDLYSIADNNLGCKEQARVAQRNAAALEAKRREIARRVEVARAERAAGQSLGPAPSECVNPE